MEKCRAVVISINLMWEIKKQRAKKNLKKQEEESDENVEVDGEKQC